MAISSLFVINLDLNHMFDSRLCEFHNNHDDDDDAEVFVVGKLSKRAQMVFAWL